ncbi:hypothetical protein [Pseudomonas syringae group sp. J254-4]|uniref:hypothetical protein n=1 Tax=Pseudomonas syringae group sp. J254-4 TaxID=3079589 RepID=UPI00290B021F|nr:hypothetical protein [Pseudomonas syringae group sp. J254-4]MDU8454867.1 hypothetical protein [Pseudomonas syringae group sp. J254-4]
MTTNPNDVRVSRETVSFEFRHPANGEAHTVSVSLEEIAHHMCEVLFEKLCGEFCQCEPVGETNVMDCRCDEYADEFERVKSYAQPADQQGEPVVFVDASELRNLTVSGFDSFSALLHREQASIVCPQRVPLYRHAQPATAKADERLTEATAFVQKLRDAASGQPSFATGYLSDILDVLQGRAKLNTPQ